jgi:hypothetical protein
MADFETQIKESQAQVAAAQAKISAITDTIEKAAGRSWTRAWRSTSKTPRWRMCTSTPR